MRLTKFLKRQVSKVLCAALVLSSVAAIGEMRVAQAISKNEIEANGTELTLNEPATGVLEAEDEQDWYIFNITERGYFSVDLQINDAADTENIHDGWKYSIYHEDDIVTAISSISSITNRYEGKELPLPKGRYYICVEASYRASWESEPVDCEYDIKVNFTGTEDWEQEYNDSNVSPNFIDVNKVYYGTLHHKADEDWYMVTTPGDGTIQMDFGPDDATDVDAIHDGWNVTILDEQLNTIREYDYKNKWTPQILPFEKGVFYIRVKASYRASWLSEPVDCIYNLQLKFTPTTDWETEYNGEYEKADVISSGDEYHGVLSWDTDEDWYKINNGTDVAASVQFRVDDSVSVDDIYDGWKIVVYSADREVIKEIKDVLKTTTEKNIILPKGTAYFKVCANYRASWKSEPVDCIYHLTVTVTPVKASNTNTGSTSKPNSTATAKPAATSSPNSASNAEIKKVITTSKVTTSTVTYKKKKSVYLRWKKQKYAGGYEIYRSTKKRKGYKKVKTIKGGSKVSWTDKKVKGGKTYYYKIRAYRKIGGKKSVSGFSKVKRVKVKK